MSGVGIEKQFADALPAVFQFQLPFSFFLCLFILWFEIRTLAQTDARSIKIYPCDRASVPEFLLISNHRIIEKRFFTFIHLLGLRFNVGR